MGIKSVLLLSVFFFNGLVLAAQSSETTIRLLLKGKEYEKIDLFIDRDNSVRSVVAGMKGKDGVWEFHIPDSIYCDHSNMRAIAGDSGFFFFDSRKDKKRGMNIIALFSVRRGVTTCLEARYLSSDTVSSEQNDGGPEYCVESVLLTGYTDKEIKTYRDLPGDYCRFYEGDYDGNLKRHIKTTRKYSDSRMAAYRFYENIYAFPEKEGIRQVFDCLSEANKNAYWGKKIQRYLDLKTFPNLMLPVCNSDRQELVIRDSTRYNLVVFSASWCSPCHELIPLLKEIYRDLKGGLEITYISMDRTFTQKQWNELVIKEQIPWRSLMGGEKLNQIMDIYTVYAYPDAYFVYPNGEFERMELSKPENKDKLYRLVKQAALQSR